MPDSENDEKPDGVKPERQSPHEYRPVHVVHLGSAHLIDPEADPDPASHVEAPREPAVASGRWQPPPVLGVRAVVGPETFRRKWPPKREPYVRPEVPKPLLPAVLLGEDDEPHLPPNARKLASAAHAAGWDVRVSFAIGPMIDSKGRPATDTIWGREVDEGGKESRRKTGETVRPQQPTVQVRVARSWAAVEAQEPDSLLMGQWLGGEYASGKWIGAGWDYGVMVYPWRRVDWRTLWATFTALCEGESAA